MVPCSVAHVPKGVGIDLVFLPIWLKNPQTRVEDLSGWVKGSSMAERCWAAALRASSTATPILLQRMPEFQPCGIKRIHVCRPGFAHLPALSQPTKAHGPGQPAGKSHRCCRCQTGAGDFQHASIRLATFWAALNMPIKDEINETARIGSGNLACFSLDMPHAVEQ